ncbi:ArsR/SmtB family transcription factor [Paramicrobacterium sp. CJ85]|uniref:ArsR/SmtB family transcription factor n=1 Tax=Paramicrobacterium sp. CJ85 TaxID=3445355 RepID=UPI003F61E7B2
MSARDRLSVAFAALADPTRRDILTRLRSGPLTITELATNYPMSRPAVSQHVSVLEKAGLVARDKRSQWIDCSLEAASLDEAAAWIEQQRAEWNERFDFLDEHLRATRARSRNDDTRNGEKHG